MAEQLKEIIGVHINFVKQSFENLEKKHIKGLYNGVNQQIDKLINDDNWWINKYDELINDDFYKELTNEVNTSEFGVEGYLTMMFEDSFDRELAQRFGPMFYNNLNNLGYKYDKNDDCWDLIGNDNVVLTTCTIWDLWYDLEEDTREAISKIFVVTFM